MNRLPPEDHPYAPPKCDASPSQPSTEIASFPRRLDLTGHDFSSRWKVCGGLGAASGLLFLISLTQEALLVGNQSWPGWGLLLMGWMSLFTLRPAWLANVALCLTWGLLPYWNARHSVLWSSGIGLTLALTTPLAIVPGGGNAADIHITGYGPGFWLWLGAIGIAGAASLIGMHPEWERENQAHWSELQGSALQDS